MVSLSFIEESNMPMSKGYGKKKKGGKSKPKSARKGK